jgi:hypothetical protein
MDEQRPQSEASHANAPHPETPPTETTQLTPVVEAPPSRNRRKVVIGVAVCIVLWIVAMFIKSLQKSEADDGRDKFGRPKGISVERRDETESRQKMQATAEGPKKRTNANIEIEADKLNQTVWAKEVEAERYEATIIKLWDDLIDAKEADRLAVFETAAPQNLTLGTVGTAQELGLGIRRIKIGAPKKPYDAAAFRKLLARGGWRAGSICGGHGDSSARSRRASTGRPAGRDSGRMVRSQGRGRQSHRSSGRREQSYTDGSRCSAGFRADLDARTGRLTTEFAPAVSPTVADHSR